MTRTGTGRRKGFSIPASWACRRTESLDLLESFRYDRGNLILANSLHKLIRDQTSSAFQDWTVGIVSGTGDQIELAPGVDRAEYAEARRSVLDRRVNRVFQGVRQQRAAGWQY